MTFWSIVYLSNIESSEWSKYDFIKLLRSNTQDLSYQFYVWISEVDHFQSFSTSRVDNDMGMGRTQSNWGL